MSTKIMGGITQQNAPLPQVVLRECGGMAASGGGRQGEEVGRKGGGGGGSRGQRPSTWNGTDGWGGEGEGGEIRTATSDPAEMVPAHAIKRPRPRRSGHARSAQVIPQRLDVRPGGHATVRRELAS